MIALVFNTSYEKVKRDQHARYYGMLLCAARLSYTVMVSYLAHVKMNVETHEMIQNCGLVYFINIEKTHQPITSSFYSGNWYTLQ